jgi:quinoprotein glucose dehydrogenase
MDVMKKTYVSTKLIRIEEKKFNLGFLIITIFFCLLFNANAISEDEYWNFSNGNFEAHKFSKLKEINTDNISNLKVAWTHKNGFIPKNKNNSQITPIFTGNSVIISTVNDNLISLDPINGKEKWRIKLKNPTAKRGLLYLQQHKSIFASTGKGVVAINEITGQINKNLGDNGYFGSSKSLLSPIVHKEKVLVAFLNKVESFSLKEGKKNWSFDLNGARVWSGFSYDKKTNTVAIVTSNLVHLWGKTEIYPDYTNSLILLNGDTGEIKCKFKDVLHDHWDFDMVGSPIFTDVKISGNTIRSVYAFSKTGNVFAININTCKFLFDKDENFEILKTDKSNYNQTYSPKQTKILLPEPLLDQKYDLENFLETLKDEENIKYLKFKTRNSKYNKDFIPLSLDYDVLMYGLHGGPSWYGGTLDHVNNQIIIPSNHYPWVLRSYYYDRLLNKIVGLNDKFFAFFSKDDYASPFQNKTKKLTSETIKKIYSKLPYLIDAEGKSLYEMKCQSCHGINRKGKYATESEGDMYIPNLVGVSFTNKIKSLKDLKNFNYSHSYAKGMPKLNEDELKKIKKYFNEYDEILKKFNLLREYGSWQLFLDKNKLPASTPPWGKINALDIRTGKINWSIPFGSRKTSSGKIIGDKNFGGVLSTAGNLIFATGTPDKFLYAYNSKSGEKIWEYQLPFAGSSSPMTYFYRGEQYILINSGGGKFFGYDENLGDLVIAFKLN